MNSSSEGSLPNHEIEAAFQKIIENLPVGGLGFHGTSDAFSKSIALNGLDAKRRVISYNGVDFTPSPQRVVFYRVFNPNAQRIPYAEDNYQALKERISTGIGIGENVARGTSGGKGTRESLLVVFKDTDGKGRHLESHGYPTMAIETVMPADIVGFYPKSKIEDENTYINRVIVDLAKKLSSEQSKLESLGV